MDRKQRSVEGGGGGDTELKELPLVMGSSPDVVTSTHGVSSSKKYTCASRSDAIGSASGGHGIGGCKASVEFAQNTQPGKRR